MNRTKKLLIGGVLSLGIAGGIAYNGVTEMRQCPQNLEAASLEYHDLKHDVRELETYVSVIRLGKEENNSQSTWYPFETPCFGLGNNGDILGADACSEIDASIESILNKEIARKKSEMEPLKPAREEYLQRREEAVYDNLGIFQTFSGVAMLFFTGAYVSWARDDIAG